MKELSRLMNNTIVLLTIIVVGGAGALLEWVPIRNCSEIGNARPSGHKNSA